MEDSDEVHAKSARKPTPPAILCTETQPRTDLSMPLSSPLSTLVAKSEVLHNTALHSCTQSNQKSRMLVELLSYRKAGEGWMLSLTKTKHSSIITVNFFTIPKLWQEITVCISMLV